MLDLFTHDLDSFVLFDQTCWGTSIKTSCATYNNRTEPNRPKPNQSKENAINITGTMSRVDLFKCFYNYICSVFSLLMNILYCFAWNNMQFLIEFEKRKKKSNSNFPKVDRLSIGRHNVWDSSDKNKSFHNSITMKCITPPSCGFVRWSHLRWVEPNSLSIMCLSIAFSFGLNGWRADIHWFVVNPSSKILHTNSFNIQTHINCLYIFLTNFSFHFRIKI